MPGGEKIRRTLEDASALVVGQPIGSYLRVLQQLHRQFADRDSSGRGLQTFDLRTTIHAVTAVESALLDLLGQHLGVPVAALLGEGQQRGAVGMLGYVFSVGYRTQTDLAYRSEPGSDNAWSRVRHEMALTPEAIVRQAEAAHERYGFNDFKLKGGVLRERFPSARVTLGPNGGWLLKDAIRLMRDMKTVVALRRRPVRRRRRFFGPRGDGRVSPRHRPADGHQHDRHRLAPADARAGAAVGGHPAGRPALLDPGRLGARGADLPRLGADLGLAFQQPFRCVAKAHQLYRQHGLGARDDGIAMQALVPNWTFNPKRPAFDC